eukprot:CAMPEP_0117607288 /NCGR_PEP_ID=MMETSP0784-20121206/80174_1 /TAXON_ID=39447 /ORGANISM="" /LENGTH=51 /DNA_ID=CAMNT_0005410443 /DNA_START=31 /DNA_END=182 /DNA_ORIENTATION=+
MKSMASAMVPTFFARAIWLFLAANAIGAAAMLRGVPRATDGSNGGAAAASG